MVTLVYILIYILFGLISGFFFKKTLSRRGSALKNYILIGIISAVICGLAGEIILHYGYAEREHRGADYVAQDTVNGETALGFTYEGRWPGLLCSLAGSLLALTILKIRDAYRYPENV